MTLDINDEIESEEEEDEGIYCSGTLECPWQGDYDELVCTDKDPDNFIYCPWCGGKEFDTL